MASQLQSLAEELLAEPKLKVNNLPKLVASLDQPAYSAVTVLHSLQQFFTGAMERGELSSKQPIGGQQQGPEAVFAAWLRRQYAGYLSALLALLASPAAEARMQLVALGALMECVRGEEAGVLNNELYLRVLEAVVAGGGVRPEVLGVLLSKYAGLADVRYYTLRSIANISARHATMAGDGAVAAGGASDDEEGTAGGCETIAGAKVSPHDLARNLHDLLTQLPPFEEGEGTELRSWCGAAEVGAVAPAADAEGSRQRKKRKYLQQSEQAAGAQVQRAKWASPKLQKKAYSDAWMALLRLDLPDDTFKRVLTRLHDVVIPAVFNPLLLSDFLTYSLDKGGLIGMLALNGIFVLVTQHGLEYPNFYARLYALVDRDAFQAKYRARFFQLADVFLASSMVPAYTAASFAKKFARLALTASPPGALVALAFIHNIIRRHPACMQMLHRPPRAGLASEVVGSSGTMQACALPSAGAREGEAVPLVYSGVDVYDSAELDPACSRAIESSLWELEALRVHGVPAVASFCVTLEKDLSDRRKTAEIDITELLPSSYASMFNAEVERRIKAVPTAFYQRAPTLLFDANCASDFSAWV